jgi:hypothetical protein
MPHMPNDAERKLYWSLHAGRDEMISPDGSRRVIFDLDYDENGPAQLDMPYADAGDCLERGHGRFVASLPAGMIAGPHVGVARILK